MPRLDVVYNLKYWLSTNSRSLSQNYGVFIFILEYLW